MEDFMSFDEIKDVNGSCVGGDEIDRLTAELAEAKKENAALREYVEIITDGGTDYPETWDELQRLGIIVEVKPTPEFIDEWGDDWPMWVLAWKAGEFEAIDAGKDGE